MMDRFCESRGSEGLLCRFVDLLTSTTSVEYVKLIVSCLDYSADDGLTRVVLQTALTSTNEAGRKWSTRFLGVIAGHELQGFAEWGMSLLLAQLSDHSAKVVRHAIRLLHRWIPFYPESISLLKNVRLDALGDAGIMLKTHLFANEDYVESNPNDVQMAFNLWRKVCFNSRDIFLQLPIWTSFPHPTLSIFPPPSSFSGRFLRGF
uniref:Rapamycin-insensitive companion of mTOR domain-containing protein n=1 Tax=Parascaris equorum TaxID=6256 RepID=A0A914RYI7_PAREQ